MRRFGHLRASVAAVAVSAALVGVTVVGCGRSRRLGGGEHHKDPGGRLAPGGVIKFAEEPGGTPNYIFPETTAAEQSLYNIYQFINLMWPLIYLPTPDEPTLDYAHSMAYPPVWSDNDTVATVTLKHYMWSDGVPVTARDLIFYINLGKADGPTWGNYSGPTAVPLQPEELHGGQRHRRSSSCSRAPINPTFFDDNGIDYITPLPQHAWDKESVNGPVGNYDMTAAGAAAGGGLPAKGGR